MKCNDAPFPYNRMLTGDEFKSGGEASLLGFDLQASRRDFLRNIGYCPQFDSIIEVLTGREMLRLFARLRGIPSADIEHNVDKWLDFLSIQQGQQSSPLHFICCIILVYKECTENWFIDCVLSLELAHVVPQFHATY